MQTQTQSQSQQQVVLFSDYSFIYNELHNALNENTKLRNSLKQQEAIVANQQQIIQRYQMIIFQQQTSSMNRPTQPQAQTFGFPPISQVKPTPVVDLTLETGMCIVNRPLMYNTPQTKVPEKKLTDSGSPVPASKSTFVPYQFVPPTPVSEQTSTSGTLREKSNKRPIVTDGDETETDDELVVKRPKKSLPEEISRDKLQKILLDINSENSDIEEELLFHNKTSVSVPVKNELENMSFNYAKKAFLNKKPVKVNFSFVAESELIDKIWYLNINGHRFLRINDDFRDTNITKFMNNEVEVKDDLKITDGVDLIEVKCTNNKWKQGITYSGMIKLLWYLANNHPQTCDKLLTKFASTLEKIVYSCEK